MDETEIGSERTRVTRLPDRGRYDRDTVNGILDEGLICHLGFVDEEQPFVIPTAYARVGDVLYVHGSASNRALRVLGRGAAVCITVTLTDGLVLARTIFNHSFNYRSMVILGTATEVIDADEKLNSLRLLTDQLLPERWDEAQAPNEQELKATSILRVPIDEASAKVRVGPPGDEGEDLEFRVWAGVIPFELRAGEPVADPRLADDLATPAYASSYTRPGWPRR